jgi:hypothetical protein
MSARASDWTAALVPRVAGGAPAPAQPVNTQKLAADKNAAARTNDGRFTTSTTPPLQLA